MFRVTWKALGSVQCPRLISLCRHLILDNRVVSSRGFPGDKQETNYMFLRSRGRGRRAARIRATLRGAASRSPSKHREHSAARSSHDDVVAACRAVM